MPRLWLPIAIALCTVSAAQAQILQDLRPWATQSKGASHSIARGRDGGLRFEVRPGDQWMGDTRRPKGHERAEVADSLRMAFGEGYVVEWVETISVIGPANTHRATFAQLHASEDRTDKVATAPVVDLRVDRGLFSVRVSYSLTDPTNKPVSKLVYVDRKRPFPFGRPVRFRVYVKTNADAQNGRLIVWRDGERIVDYVGPLGYVDRRGPYWKMGLYRLSDSSTMVAEVSQLSGPRRGEP